MAFQQLLLDWGTTLAFGAICIDLLFQIARVYRRRSAADISVWGYGIRYISAFLLLLKFSSLSDIYLLIGQVMVVVLLTIYFGLILRYRRPRKA